MDFNLLNQFVGQSKVTEICIAILLAILTHYVTKEIFAHIFHFVEKPKSETYLRRELRTRTFLKVINNIVSSIIAIGLLYSIFVILNINLSAFIAVGSVIAIAVGFGSQQFVKDIFNGVFFLYQDQFGVGDFIIANGITGRVINLSIRTITLEDITGAVTILNNGYITQLTNYSKENYNSYIDVSVSASVHIDDVINAINEVIQNNSPHTKIKGILDIQGGKVTIRIKLQLPFEQYIDESMKIRYDLKKKFEEKNIDFA